ncbi:MAG: hypothetical protein D6E12_03705 [Desulfovibrio sp.]|nr:MAG: hypothetical protein D6E12_03705 [Desulfovibrio sp.]
MDGTLSSVQRAGMQAYQAWALRAPLVAPGASGSAKSASSSGKSSTPASLSDHVGIKRKGFSFRLGKLAVSYSHIEQDLDSMLSMAEDLANKRESRAFLSEMEIADLRGNLFDPDHPDSRAPGTGIMRRQGVDAYAHAAQSLDSNQGPRRTLIGTV